MSSLKEQFPVSVEFYRRVRSMSQPAFQSQKNRLDTCRISFPDEYIPFTTKFGLCLLFNHTSDYGCLRQKEGNCTYAYHVCMVCTAIGTNPADASTHGAFSKYCPVFLAMEMEKRINPAIQKELEGGTSFIAVPQKPSFAMPLAWDAKVFASPVAQSLKVNDIVEFPAISTKQSQFALKQPSASQVILEPAKEALQFVNLSQTDQTDEADEDDFRSSPLPVIPSRKFPPEKFSLPPSNSDSPSYFILDRSDVNRNSKGGHSEVFLNAIYCEFGFEMKAVVKMVEYSNTSSSTEKWKALKRDIKALTLLSRKTQSVVCILNADFVTLSDQRVCHVMLMEQCDTDLGCWVASAYSERRQISVSDIRGLTQQLLSAYRAIHKENICHRDVKPDNILIKVSELSSVPILKLCDFGFSAGLELQVGSLVMKTFVGAREYQRGCFVSPEMIGAGKKNSSYRKTSDVWSLGLIIYFISVGSIPFSSIELVEQAARDPVLLESILSSDGLHTRYPLLFDLVCSLVQPVETRISLDAISYHPFLWGDQDAVRIFQFFGDELREQPKVHKKSSGFLNFVKCLESAKPNIAPSSWWPQIPAQIRQVMSEHNRNVNDQPEPKDVTSIRGLLITIRNSLEHYASLANKIKVTTSLHIQHTIARLFMEAFPQLFIHVFRIATQCGTWEPGFSFQFSP